MSDKQKTVISANYRNRGDKQNPWLTRGEKEALEAYRLAKHVYAQDVTFTYSYQGEKGFGCAIVAVSTKVNLEDKLKRAATVPSDASPVHFNGFYDFYVNEDVEHCRLKRVDELWLTEDGKMFAVGLHFKS